MDIAVNTTVLKMHTSGWWSDDPRNAPSNAQMLFLGLEIVPVLPLVSIARKPGLTRSKKSKRRRGEQGSALTRLYYRYEHHHKYMVYAPSVSCGSGLSRLPMHYFAHRRTKDTRTLPHRP